MTSRYDNKTLAQDRAWNATRKIAPERGASHVPRWLKRMLYEGLEKRGSIVFFGGVFLSKLTIEVIWPVKVPADAPTIMKIWKTTYRLRHRLLSREDTWDYGWGELRLRSGIGCGFKCQRLVSPFFAMRKQAA